MNGASYVRPVIAAAALAGVAYAAGRWWVAALIVGYVCFVRLVLWRIREHGPVDPPVSQLRQRQIAEYCREQEVEP